MRIRLWQDTRPYETQPDTYFRPLNTLFLMTAREYAPAPERAKLALARLEKLPTVLAAAKRQPEAAAQGLDTIAIERVKGGLDFLKEIAPFLTSALPAEKTRIDAAIAASKKAFEELGVFFEKELLPRSDGKFAAGKELFEFLLHEDAALRESADDLHVMGTKLVDKIQTQMREVAKKIDPAAKDWPEVVAKVKSKHPAANDLLAAYRKEVTRAREFLVKKDVVPFPPGIPGEYRTSQFR
ncbi:MAG: DUF885 family protein [Polyangiaceae bacterium]